MFLEKIARQDEVVKKEGNYSALPHNRSSLPNGLNLEANLGVEINLPWQRYLDLWHGEPVVMCSLVTGAGAVVDSVIRSLCKKLNHHDVTIETVTDVGYRFRGF